MSEILTCKDLTKRYGTETALRSATISLAGGEALLVRGPNGSGKSTLVAILAGLVRADGGSALLNGEPFDPDRHDLRKSIGLGPANETSLFLSATVRRNLQFWAEVQGVAQARERIERLAQEWDFARYLDRRAFELSSGFRRRVAIARAFLHEPRLVLLDEPFAFLDNEHQETASTAFERWLESTGGALVVTSNMDFRRGPRWKVLDLNPTSSRE